MGVAQPFRDVGAAPVHGEAGAGLFHKVSSHDLFDAMRSASLSEILEQPVDVQAGALGHLMLLAGVEPSAPFLQTCVSHW